jgi:hypothetical protein
VRRAKQAGARKARKTRPRAINARPWSALQRWRNSTATAYRWGTSRSMHFCSGVDTRSKPILESQNSFGRFSSNGAKLDTPWGGAVWRVINGAPTHVATITAAPFDQLPALCSKASANLGRSHQNPCRARCMARLARWASRSPHSGWTVSRASTTRAGKLKVMLVIGMPSSAKLTRPLSNAASQSAERRRPLCTSSRCSSLQSTRARCGRRAGGPAP